MGVALVSDLSDLSDKMGAPRYTPWVCGGAVWFGSGCRFTAEVCCQRDGNGGVLSAGVWHNKTVTNGG